MRIKITRLRIVSLLVLVIGGIAIGLGVPFFGGHWSLSAVLGGILGFTTAQVVQWAERRKNHRA